MKKKSAFGTTLQQGVRITVVEGNMYVVSSLEETLSHAVEAIQSQSALSSKTSEEVKGFGII